MNRALEKRSQPPTAMSSRRRTAARERAAAVTQGHALFGEGLQADAVSIDQEAPQ